MSVVSKPLLNNCFVWTANYNQVLKKNWMCLKRSITLILIQELLGTSISCFYNILIREILHYVISYDKILSVG